MKTIYLDYAAATPVDPAVAKAMEPYFSEKFYNPSATYLAALQVAKDIEKARGRVAHWFGARSTEIVFTAGGTEANNLAIHGVMQAFPGKKVLVSSIEHEAVLAPAKVYKHELLTVDNTGRVDVEKLAKMIDDQTVMISVMYANNEVGTIQPIRAICELIAICRMDRQKRGIKTPLYMHTDACQAAGYLDIHCSRLGVDLMTINAGKIYGPKQSGALFVKTGVEMSPQILGGGQERNMRSGTENSAGIVGLATALDLVQGRRQQESKRLKELRDWFIKEIKQNFPKAVINGSLKQRLPNNVHVTFPGQDNERLLMQLDEAGIICAAGSACSASKETASHVLAAMGVSEKDAYASLRLTFGHKTTKAQLEEVISKLNSFIHG